MEGVWFSWPIAIRGIGDVTLRISAFVSGIFLKIAATNHLLRKM
jgi:hypothetical protein